MSKIINKILFDGTLNGRQLQALEERLELASCAIMVAGVFTGMVSFIWLIQIMRGIA